MPKKNYFHTFTKAAWAVEDADMEGVRGLMLTAPGNVNNKLPVALWFQNTADVPYAVTRNINPHPVDFEMWWGVIYPLNVYRAHAGLLTGDLLVLW